MSEFERLKELNYNLLDQYKISELFKFIICKEEEKIEYFTSLLIEEIDFIKSGDGSAFCSKQTIKDYKNQIKIHNTFIKQLKRLFKNMDKYNDK